MVSGILLSFIYHSPSIAELVGHFDSGAGDRPNIISVIFAANICLRLLSFVGIVSTAAIRWRIHDLIDCVSISRKHGTIAVFPPSRVLHRTRGADADGRVIIYDRSISRSQVSTVNYLSQKWLHLDRFVSIQPAESLSSIIVHRSKN
jgi:hypothetical protein